jgi:hypothetical protein
MNRRTVIAVALSLLTPVAVAVAAPTASASPSAGDGCYPTNYGVRYEIRTADSTPVVTHAWNKVLAPGGSWSRTTTIAKITVVEASVEYHSEASVGADTVLAKAEVKAGINLRAAGAHTRSKSIEEMVSLRNTTKRNREYVVFAGTVKHFGRYKKWTCNSSTYQVETKFGDWKSWTVISDGTIRCDLAAPNRVARKAKAKYCG